MCKGCAHSAELAAPHLLQWIGHGTDGRFGLPRYLTCDVGGNELWVHNLQHLEALADWLGATLRERAAGDGLKNRTMMSRLPKWMKSASARPAVMKGLEKLRVRGTARVWVRVASADS